MPWGSCPCPGVEMTLCGVCRRLPDLYRRFDALSDDQVRQLCMSGDAQDMSYAMDEMTRRNDLRGSQGTSIPTGRRVSMQGLQALFEAGMAP